MDQYSSKTTTIPSFSSSSSSSSHPPHLPLFLESLPLPSPSSLFPLDPSHPLVPPPHLHPSPVLPRNSKKRSRASRRAPTTVLTTDTSNFRAMVQEFTGIPSSPFSSSSSSSSLLSLPSRSHLHFPSRFLIGPSSHKHQTSTTPYTPPFPPLSSTSNTFLQSLINTQPVFAVKPPYPSPPAFSTAGREEPHQSHQGGTMLDSWVCSSAYK